MYDYIIIGGSVAGVTAGVYSARRGLKFKVIASDLGGEVATSGEIENWPGIKHTTGVELSGMFADHLRSYEPDILEGVKVSGITRGDDGTFT
ncbi:MAG TPA: alkyl hydroperoxide reductase subunit F, partial [Candidatus Paceibacterota bacterium]|nr:alkyl hydroperoxide reductase subunit F [Candidatus Paceibacterota bacterium]